MPQELEDLEDLTVSDPDVEKYDVLLVVPDATSVTTPSSRAPLTLHQRLLQLPKEVRNIIAGGIAGMVAKSVVAPLDRIKILYQVTSAEFRIRNIPTVTRNIIVNEGWSALWKGNIATMLRVFPYAGVQFMVFDRVKMWYLRQHELLGIRVDATNAAAHTNPRKFGLTAMESLVAGMIAGTISVTCTYPLDLTRAQLAVLKRHKHSDASKTKGFVRVLLDNYRRSGVAGLFRGMPITLFGILPYSGIAFALNEQGKREVGTCTFLPGICCFTYSTAH